MTFVVVFVGLAVFFVSYFLVRAIAIRLVLRQSAHANPDRAFLRLDLERLFIGFDDSAHDVKDRLRFLLHAMTRVLVITAPASGRDG